MQALIDADILAYQAASTSERAVKWDDDLWTLHSFESEAQEHFHDMVLNITTKAGADSAVLVWTDSANWRKEVLPTYKSNRAGVRKPLVLSALREWAQDKYESRVLPTLEGDDVLGLMATDPALEGGVIVCSLDKDLQTIPGGHYNFGKDEKFLISTHQANRYHMYQTLIGDATDGYKGCPGIGPVAATKILDAVDQAATPWASEHTYVSLMWEAVVKAYAKAGLGEEEALCQAQVARILRYGEYDFNTQQVKPWTPPITQKAA